jgi:hypothetical protein
MLINVLIIFFILLIFYQIFILQFLYKTNHYNIIEGLATSSQYQPYDMNNPNNAMILAQQNAGNIQVLKQQIDQTLGLVKQVQDISGNLATLTSQVNGLMSIQKQNAESKLPTSPPKITGIE